MATRFGIPLILPKSSHKTSLLFPKFSKPAAPLKIFRRSAKFALALIFALLIVFKLNYLCGRIK